jgi:hypothetical protein
MRNLIVQGWIIGVAIAILAATGAQAAERYGAIAYSPQSGAYGYSYDYNSRADAENVAINNCRQHGTGCEIAIWFRNACGAVATGRNGGWGSAWANSRAAAENMAINYCSNYTTNCSVLVWSCTSR